MAWLRWLLALCVLSVTGTAWADRPSTVLSRGEPPPRGEAAPTVRDLGPFEYAGTWEYRWGDAPRDAIGQLLWAKPHSHSSEWTQLGRFDGVPGRNGSAWLWLRSELPPFDLVDPVFWFPHLDQEFQVYLEGQLIYEWGDFSTGIPAFLGYRGHIVRLPPHAGGKRITLRIYSDHRNIGPAGPIRFGEHSQILVHLFKTDLPRQIVGGFMLLLALSSLVLFVQRREERVFVIYAVLAVSGAVYILSQSQLRMLLFDHPLGLTYVELWSLQITLLALCYFVAEMFGEGPGRVLYWLQQAQWVYLLGSTVAVAAGLVPVLRTLFPVQMMLFFLAVVTVFWPLFLALRGSVEARIFVIGFFGAGAIAVHDVFVALGLLSRSQPKMGHIGYALFFVTLGVILARRVLRAHERLQNYTSMLSLSLASSRVLVPDERAQVALSELVRLLSARRSFLFLRSEQTGELEFASGRSSEGVSLSSPVDADLSFVAQCQSSQKPMMRRTSDKRGVIMAAPLQVRGQPLGVLYIEIDAKRQGLHEEDLDVLIGLAHQVAISIVSARTLRIEMDAAMTQKRMQEQRLLLDAAVRMAAGDLSTPVQVPPGSAMQHLAEALEAMRTDLLTKVLQMESKGREVQTLNEELRRQIAERSRRLMSVIIKTQAGKNTPLPDLSPGKMVVGRYKVVRKIGEGAMGVVHEVERVSDGRHLAAKFVPQLSDKKSLLRFMREAQILARLRHPNLIGIADVDMTAGGILFMVMDLVVGSSLKLARRRFGEVRWALCVLRQIAEALAAIHEAGIVHRDLKPDNVLLAGGAESPLPFVKLADFGVSLLVSKVQTAQLQRASAQQQGTVDPLEESIEMPVPGADWFDREDPEAEWDALVGDADTADIPVAHEPPLPGVLLSSGQPAAGDASLTLRADPAVAQARLTPVAITKRAEPAQAGGARRVSVPDSLAASPDGTASGVQEQVTQSGILIGTPMYMAPELWHSGSHLAQLSSDLFSFGVIAFELLTSVLPSLQPPIFSYAQKQPMRIAKLSTSRSELDARLCALIDGCLSEQPTARPTARVVVETLRELGAPTPMMP